MFHFRHFPWPSFPLLLLSIPFYPQLAANHKIGHNIGQVLQLTDFHIDPDYSPDGLPVNNCHKVRGQRGNLTRRPFGNYDCDSPELLMNFAIAEAKRIVPHPDFLVWTGDSVAHLKDYNTDYVLNALEKVTDSLHRHFPSTPVLPVLGNHDAAPAHQLPDRPSELYFRIFNLWENAGWLGDGQKETFLHGGYYSIVRDGAHFIVLNTNLYFVCANESAYMDGGDPAGQFAFLESQMARVKARNGQVHILAHVPPGVFERIPHFAWMHKKYNWRFVQILAKYAQWIRWLLFGHNHTDTFRVIKDSTTGAPLLPLLLAPSITPFNGRPTGNPAFRLYEFHKSTGSIVDIKNFYVNLARLNREGLAGNVHFSLEYSMRQAFQMDNFSAHSFSALIGRIKRNPHTFEQYIRFNTAMYPEGMEMPTGRERGAHLCALEFVQLDQYQKCMGEYVNYTAFC